METLGFCLFLTGSRKEPSVIPRLGSFQTSGAQFISTPDSPGSVKPSDVRFFQTAGRGGYCVSFFFDVSLNHKSNFLDLIRSGNLMSEMDWEKFCRSLDVSARRYLNLAESHPDAMGKLVTVAVSSILKHISDAARAGITTRSE